MPKYMSAFALEITEGERKWLIKTMGVLATLRPKQRKKVDGLALAFHMNYVLRGTFKNDKELCNSVGCIKGWMSCLAAVAKKGDDLGILRSVVDPREQMKHGLYSLFGFTEPGFAQWDESDPLKNLFYPQSDVINYNSLTPKQAASAIRSFLETGVIRWPKPR